MQQWHVIDSIQVMDSKLNHHTVYTMQCLIVGIVGTPQSEESEGDELGLNITIITTFHNIDDISSQIDTTITEYRATSIKTITGASKQIANQN